MDLMFGAGCEYRGSIHVCSKVWQLRQGPAPFETSAQRPEVVVLLELKGETQLPSRFVLCIIVREDKVARQVQVKILTRPPIVNIPLEQKPVRVPVLLERTTLAQGDHADAAWHAPAWP